MNKEAYYKEIIKLKQHYRSDLLILGHFYMHPDILQLADIIGDSYLLSVKASKASAKNIIFCGVYFMAESARILCKEEQHVLIPDKGAGCPLADTITPDAFTNCMSEISLEFGDPPISV